MYVPLSDAAVNEIATLVLLGTADSDVGAVGVNTVIDTHVEPFHTFIRSESVSKIIWPVNGDGTSVDLLVDVVIVTPDRFEANFPCVTAFAAIFPLVTAPLAIFDEVTAPSAIFASVTDPVAIGASF
jgi:hypothetical protein